MYSFATVVDRCLMPSVLRVGLLVLVLPGEAVQAQTALSQPLRASSRAMLLGADAEETPGNPLPRFTVARLGESRFGPTAQPVMDLAFSPDGQTLATLNSGPTRTLLELWNVSDGRRHAALYASEWSFVTHPRSFSFAPDGSALAMGCVGSIVLWDQKTREVRTVWDDRDSWVASVTFSSDAKLLAWVAAERDNSSSRVVVYDLTGNKPACAIHLPAVARAVRFVPQHKLVATIACKHELQLWDVATGKCVRSIRHPGVVLMAFSPDGAKLATCARKGPVRIWNVATGRRTLKIDPPNAEVADLKFMPGGERLAALVLYEAYDAQGIWSVSSCLKPNFLVWNATSGELATKLRTPYEDTHFAFSPDGKLLATAGGKYVCVRRFPSNEDLLPGGGHTAGVRFLAYLSRGKLLASCGHDGRVLVWEVSQRRVIWEPAVPTCAIAMAASPKGDLLAIGAWEHGVDVWDVSQKKCIKVLKAGRRELPCELVFSPDGGRLACGDGIGRVVIWNVDTGQVVRSWEPVHTDPLKSDSIESLAWSPDGKILVAADGYRLRWLDTESGQVLRQMESEDTLKSATLSPDGRLLALVRKDQCIVENASNGRELLRTATSLYPWTRPVFSPDSRLLVTRDASSDFLQFLDLRTGEKHSLFGTTANVWAFSPNGRFLAVSKDSTILIFSVKRILRKLAH